MNHSEDVIVSLDITSLELCANQDVVEINNGMELNAYVKLDLVYSMEPVLSAHWMLPQIHQEQVANVWLLIIFSILTHSDARPALLILTILTMIQSVFATRVTNKMVMFALPFVNSTNN